MRTSIIIPSHNGLQLLESCVASIRAHTGQPYELIVVDNGSTDGTVEYCRRERITLIALPANVGFPAACNYGLRLATGDALLLMNNDVVVTRNWLGNMLGCLTSAPDIGIVGPYTNYASGKQQRQVEYADLDEFQRIAASFNEPDPQRWEPLARIVGICFLFGRNLLDRIGYLDERFSPGHYEDDDYCHRARLAGFRHMLAGDVLVYHQGSASFRKEQAERIAALVDRNWRKFIDKWGFDPRQYI